MISFWSAAGYHQLTMYPLPFFSLAAKTKQASCGPKLVANMPAPQGHQVFFNLGFPFSPALSMALTLLTACMACSSPGYEIFGITGKGPSHVGTGALPGFSTGLPGLPMQP